MEDGSYRAFNLLDEWRHLPNYQLERRADVFFAIYLPKFLSQRLSWPIDSRLIPEFPARIGAVYPNIASNQSVKIDYVALDEDRSRTLLIELKTDGSSRRDKQDRYLRAAQDLGLPGLVDGVVHIFRATNAKRKYACLLRLLEDLRLLVLPDRFHEFMARPNLNGITACLDDIQITAPTARPEIIYLQPKAASSEEIGFDDLAAWLDTLGDHLASRFAQSLRTWAAVLPGEPASGSMDA
jgi:hypothetical protein